MTEEKRAVVTRHRRVSAASILSVISMLNDKIISKCRKKVRQTKRKRFLISLFVLVFDNLNNLYKRLSILAIEQQMPLINSSSHQAQTTTTTTTSGTLQSISSTSTTMSRHGSIFYDAPEALSCLLLNEDKEEIEKMVK